MTLNFNTTAPLHLNGELLSTAVKRNTLDQENKTNWTALQSAINYNSGIAGTGLQSDNLGTASILPRNLSKQMGSKDFYYYDPVQGTNYFSTSYSRWYVAGLAGGSILSFTNSTQTFITNTTPLSIVVADNNSTIELNVNLEQGFTNQSNHQMYSQDIELSLSPTFATILQTKTAKFFNANSNSLQGQRLVTFTALNAGTYYIRLTIKCDTAVYVINVFGMRTTINYQVSNATFN